MPERTYGGIFPDVERVDVVIAQMPSLGFGAHYVEAVQAARDALANQSTESRPRSGVDPEPWVYYDGTRRSESPYPEGSENPFRVLWKHEPRPEYSDD